MEAPLNYVLTENEFAKLKSIARFSAQGPPETSQPRVPAGSAETLRPFIRLFIKSWAVSLALNRTLLKRRSRLNSLRIATVLVSAAGSFRILHVKFAKPVISGAVTGLILALGLPAEATVYLTLYLATKLGEWGCNYATLRHWLDWLPRQVGGWMLVPLAYSQLFYTFFAHPERTPTSFKRFITWFSNGALVPNYPGIAVPQRFKSRTMGPNSLATAIFRALSVGRPTFNSPLLQKNSDAPIVSPNMLNPPIVGFLERLVVAHPGNTTIIGALMHPRTDNGREFWSQTMIKNLRASLKILVPLYGLRSFFAHRSIRSEVITALRMALAYSLMFTSSLSGISFSQYWLGSRVSPHLRLRLLGFLSGLSAILISQSGKTQFLYMTRLALATMIPASAQRTLGIAALPLVLGLASLVIEKRNELVKEAYYSQALNWLQTGRWQVRTYK